MAQTDYTSIVLLAAAGTFAYYAYEQGWFSVSSSTTSGAAATAAAPMIDTNIISASEQSKLIAMMRSSGLTDAQILQYLNRAIGSYNYCVNGCQPGQTSPCGPGLVPPGMWNSSLGSSFNVTDPSKLPDNFDSACSGGGSAPPLLAPPTTMVPISSQNVPATTVSATIPTAPYSQTDQPWAMQMAALSSSNTLNVDQWNYYFNQLANSTWAGTLSPISGSQMSAMLAALANLGQSRSSAMTLPQWYWLVTAGGGLSGLGNYSGIPMGAIHQGGYQ